MTTPDSSAERLIPFRTRLGWIGILACNGWIRRIRFGYSSRDSLVAGFQNGRFKLVQPGVLEQRWVETLQRYATGEEVDFSSFPLDLRGRSPFGRAILDHCREIPYGSTMTYRQLATRAGFPRAARAVGNVMRTNDHPIVIPCHRIIRSDRRIGNFSAPTGASMKRQLLELEGVLPKNACVNRTSQSGFDSSPHMILVDRMELMMD